MSQYTPIDVPDKTPRPSALVREVDVAFRKWQARTGQRPMTRDDYSRMTFGRRLPKRHKAEDNEEARGFE